MIQFVQGNFFSYKADIRVNTVNCVGVMGAGVALQFKKRYPEMNKEYVRLCDQGLIRPGRPHVWKNNHLFNEDIEDVTIINFPTKDHWKKPSEYHYIEAGLQSLREFLIDKPNSIITIPALGCGHGGLNWNTVKRMIIHYLSDLRTSILVFEPESSVSEAQILSEREMEILNRRNIRHIRPSDSEYPLQLKGKSTIELYIEGDINVLTKKTISLITNNKATDREVNALIGCLNQLQNKEFVFVLGLNSSIDLDLLKEIILRKFRVIVVLSTGILQQKTRKDIEDIWDKELITTISMFPPNQNWRKYSNIQISKFAIEISKSILINTIDTDYLKYIEKELVNHNSKFYISYWKERIAFFENIHAESIGKNYTTGLPNVKKIEEVE